VRRIRYYFWRGLGLFFLVVVLLGLMSYFFPQRVLTVDSGVCKADVIVVLGGGMASRSERAVQLFMQDEAPKILVSGFGDNVSNEKVLENNGVPAGDISLESKSRTTRENAEFSIPLLRQMDAHRVIIVTSWYHSRRALMCFEHYAPDIKFYSRPSYFGYARTDSNRKKISGYMKSEYWKLLGYWVCYGVCPI